MLASLRVIRGSEESLQEVYGIILSLSRYWLSCLIHFVLLIDERDSDEGETNSDFNEGETNSDFDEEETQAELR